MPCDYNGKNFIMRLYFKGRRRIIKSTCILSIFQKIHTSAIKCQFAVPRGTLNFQNTLIIANYFFCAMYLQSSTKAKFTNKQFRYCKVLLIPYVAHFGQSAFPCRASPWQLAVVCLARRERLCLRGFAPRQKQCQKRKHLCAIRPQFIKKNGGSKSAVKFHFIFAALRGTSTARQKLNISWECLCRPFRAIRLPMMPGVPTAARCRLSRASGASSSPSIRTQSKTMPKTKILSNIS